jgi:hypothetical protein
LDETTHTVNVGESVSKYKHTYSIIHHGESVDQGVYKMRIQEDCRESS